VAVTPGNEATNPVQTTTASFRVALQQITQSGSLCLRNNVRLCPATSTCATIPALLVSGQLRALGSRPDNLGFEREISRSSCAELSRSFGALLILVWRISLLNVARRLADRFDSTSPAYCRSLSCLLSQHDCVSITRPLAEYWARLHRTGANRSSGC